MRGWNLSINSYGDMKQTRSRSVRRAAVHKPLSPVNRSARQVLAGRKGLPSLSPQLLITIPKVHKIEASFLSMLLTRIPFILTHKSSSYKIKTKRDRTLSKAFGKREFFSLSKHFDSKKWPVTKPFDRHNLLFFLQ